MMNPSPVKSSSRPSVLAKMFGAKSEKTKHQVAIVVCDVSASDGPHLFYIPPALVEESVSCVRQGFFIGSDEKWALMVAKRFGSLQVVKRDVVSYVKAFKNRNRQAIKVITHGVYLQVHGFRVPRLPVAAISMDAPPDQEMIRLFLRDKLLEEA